MVPKQRTPLKIYLLKQTLFKIKHKFSWWTQRVFIRKRKK